MHSCTVQADGTGLGRIAEDYFKCFAYFPGMHVFYKYICWPCQDPNIRQVMQSLAALAPQQELSCMHAFIGMYVLYFFILHACMHTCMHALFLDHACYRLRLQVQQDQTLWMLKVTERKKARS